MKLKIDAIDRVILKRLQNDSNVTNAALSQEIGLSPAPTLERVKKLSSVGIIKSFNAVLERSKIGLEVCVFLFVNLKSQDKDMIAKFARAIDKIDEVIEVYQLAGEHDFVMKIVASSLKTYESILLDKIATLGVLKDYHTAIVLNTVKESKVLPVV